MGIMFLSTAFSTIIIAVIIIVLLRAIIHKFHKHK
jgi:hypothetical protein